MNELEDRNQRVGPIAGLAALLGEFGIQSRAFGEEFGVDLDRLTPDAREPFGLMLRMLREAASRAGCPHLGLLLGSRYRPAEHGPIHRLMATAPTLRDALLDFVHWQFGYSTAAIVYLDRIGDDFALGYGAYERTAAATPLLYEMCAAIGVNMIHELTGGAVSPVEIHFAHRPAADLAPYQRILRAPVRFNQNQTCLVLRAAALDAPLPGFDPVARARLIQAMAAHGFASLPASARLRRIVRPQILKDDPSMAGAARVLRVHPRTLRRQLAAEGVSFEQVRDEVRFMLARELLQLTDLPIGDISNALAFATHAAFVRAFRRWSGAPPTVWRAAARLSASSPPSANAARSPAAA